MLSIHLFDYKALKTSGLLSTNCIEICVFTSGRSNDIKAFFCQSISSTENKRSSSLLYELWEPHDHRIKGIFFNYKKKELKKVCLIKNYFFYFVSFCHDVK